MAKKKPIFLRLFNTLCSLTIIVAACYLFFAGMDLLGPVNTIGLSAAGSYFFA